jgi:hypothetical protein
MCHNLIFNTAQKWRRQKEFEIPNYGDFLRIWKQENRINKKPTNLFISRFKGQNIKYFIEYLGHISLLQ